MSFLLDLSFYVTIFVFCITEFGEERVFLLDLSFYVNIFVFCITEFDQERVFLCVVLRNLVKNVCFLRNFMICWHLIFAFGQIDS